MVVWLREALDAAQADAEAATAATGGPHWHGSDSGLYSNDASNHPGPFLADAYGYTDPRVVAHVTRHDPAAVLRRIAADRKILAEHAENPYDLGYCRTCTVHEDGWAVPVPAELPCATIRNLAEGWGWTEETT
jgi:hypothetical protein